MEPRIRIRPAGSPIPRPKVTPKTIVVSGLLELASVELERAILQEVAENPALQVVEAAHCERCGATFSGSVCPRCVSETRETPPPDWTADWGGSVRTRWTQEAEWDPFSKVAAPWSIRDHLLWQLCPLLSASELEIASLVLENLDHRGLLDCDLETIASILDVPLTEVERVLGVVQRQDPAGIAARTLRERLLIQLDCLDCEEGVAGLCKLLIEDHWEALGKGKLERIARELQLGIEDIGRARDFMRANLDPYPVHAFLDHPKPADEPVEAHYLRPDVVITVHGPEGSQEFEIRFPAEGRFRLSLDGAYRALMDAFDNEPVHGNPGEYDHVRQCVGRGKLFISGWQERWRTLRRIVEGMVEYQREFLLNDARSLRPLTRAQLAEMVGVHESTVSRAVASKYALIPGGRIVALSDFFDGSLRAKVLIEDLISEENHPLTDGALVELLAQAGVRVARRTVAKYRQALRILPSELR